jgi:hypothetical protein
LESNKLELIEFDSISGQTGARPAQRETRLRGGMSLDRSDCALCVLAGGHDGRLPRCDCAAAPPAPPPRAAAPPPVPHWAGPRGCSLADRTALTLRQRYAAPLGHVLDPFSRVRAEQAYNTVARFVRELPEAVAASVYAAFDARSGLPLPRRPQRPGAGAGLLRQARVALAIVLKFADAEQLLAGAAGAGACPLRCSSVVSWAVLLLACLDTSNRADALLRHWQRCVASSGRSASPAANSPRHTGGAVFARGDFLRYLLATDPWRVQQWSAAVRACAEFPTQAEQPPWPRLLAAPPLPAAEIPGAALCVAAAREPRVVLCPGAPAWCGEQVAAVAMQLDDGMLCALAWRLRAAARAGELGRPAYDLAAAALVRVAKRACLGAADDRAGGRLFDAVWGRQLGSAGTAARRQPHIEDFVATAAAVGRPQAVRVLQQAIATHDSAPDRSDTHATVLNCLLERVASPQPGAQ